jgi:hypothetical protein
MMTGSVMGSACGAGECLRAGAASVPASSGAGGLAVAALASWLVAELFGAYMLRSWIAGGGVRDRQATPRGLSPVLIFCHAGLALAGLLSWVSFVATGAAAFAWTGIGFLAPAIGLGISTVTVWTPFPLLRPQSAAQARSERRGNDQVSPVGPDKPETGPARSAQETPATLATNDMISRALDDEALTGKLVDELLERMLARPAPPSPADRRWQLAPVIPILHGVLAITTFLLAMLAAVIAVAS